MKKIKEWLSNFMSGTKGRVIRAIAPTLIGFAVGQYSENEWYVAAGPLLTLGSRKLHEKFPGKFDWLPF